MLCLETIPLLGSLREPAQTTEAVILAVATLVVVPVQPLIGHNVEGRITLAQLFVHPLILASTRMHGTRSACKNKGVQYCTYIGYIAEGRQLTYSF